MTGRFITSYFGREHVFDADDLIVAALERVIRERLARGQTMFFSAAGATESGRDWATVILTPQTWAQFSYTDLGHGPTGPAHLTATVELLRDHIERFGGVTLDDHDLPVEPND